MNIGEAKQQIKNAITVYFAKDEYGSYVIPIEKQRPVFLLGAPGIGKTAIMEQIAQELSVPIVSYSMTHHTRQSALGLPFISHKVYGGKEFDVSEYTMSEIIASVYDMIEKTGKKEGILFLDEINCVSETLSPIMLQFLQYKVFGKHRVPDGWIVVTAGNPPEYNNSVHEFDIVTWDRLKRIDVEPDYACWREYALNANVHPSILTYLDLKRDKFYKIQSTIDGKTFVTARGWEDLSKIIHLYEKHDLEVDENLIRQYLQDGQIASSFASYYDLFNKYKNDYQIESILDGKATAELTNRAVGAPFDERIALLSLLLDGVFVLTSDVMLYDEFLRDYMRILLTVKDDLAHHALSIEECLDKAIESELQSIDKLKAAGSLSEALRQKKMQVVLSLKELKKLTFDCSNNAEVIKAIKGDFDAKEKERKSKGNKAKKKLDNAFDFLEGAFLDGQEMSIFVTELTANKTSAKFISTYGSDGYYRHNSGLLLNQRVQEINQEIENLELGE